MRYPLRNFHGLFLSFQSLVCIENMTRVDSNHILILSRVLLKNDQTYFKNLAVFTRLYNKSAKVKQIIKKLLVLYISLIHFFFEFSYEIVVYETLAYLITNSSLLPFSGVQKQCFLIFFRGYKIGVSARSGLKTMLWLSLLPYMLTSLLLSHW